MYDVSPESLKLAHEEQGVPTECLFRDIDELFSRIVPKCVIVATTADSHCELTCMAAERGAKLIFVEKPMAVSLAECDRMLETCARTGTKLSVNHQMRFMPQYREAQASAVFRRVRRVCEYDGRGRQLWVRNQRQMRASGKRLGWKGGVNKRSVSELALAFIIAMLRHVPRADREVRAGHWRQHVGGYLTGRTVGVIGCGNVGKDLV